MNILLSPTLTGFIRAIYLWIVGVSIGGIIACGAFSAPVIFHAQDYGVDIDKFQSGIIMTQVFLKFNNLLVVTAFVIAIFEVFSFKVSAHTKIQKAILLISGAISVVCVFLFKFVYSAYIVAQQKLGPAATSSSEFHSMHSQSEIVFHILFATLSINFIYRIVLYSRSKMRH